jgi:hypothetical protein
MQAKFFHSTLVHGFNFAPETDAHMCVQAENAQASTVITLSIHRFSKKRKSKHFIAALIATIIIPLERSFAKQKGNCSRNENETEKFSHVNSHCGEGLVRKLGHVEQIGFEANKLRLSRDLKSISSSARWTRNGAKATVVVTSLSTTPPPFPVLVPLLPTLNLPFRVCMMCVCKYYLEPIIFVLLQLLMPPEQTASEGFGRENTAMRRMRSCIRIEMQNANVTFRGM